MPTMKHSYVDLMTSYFYPSNPAYPQAPLLMNPAPARDVNLKTQ